MTPSVAIVGMACQYPDARSPSELWENVLSQRRAFRRLPAERLRIEDYLDPDPAAPDRTYAAEAAVIEGYEFDRRAFRVVGSTYRSADLAHWLALDVAASALEDSGFILGEGLPRETTGVFLGNTLTGEFSRANVLRLRWPYLRRLTDSALRDEGWNSGRRRNFLEALESRFKSPFPPVGPETLAGGLSNTIAGRICNHFDLKGGGYTVDGACASSLLAVCHACASLVTGEIDVALAGGVDLSLDPFELVGFAKTGALAPEMMRVYDARSAGFWPGEGCGVVVLMRLDDALAGNHRVDAVIRGWGISSDGQGGITRPEVNGQLLALERAYRRARFGIDTVAYIEGHGTGTGVGDATELQALCRARELANPAAPPAVIGSIKANIGHTKAAAGVAGLIKAAMVVRHRILPPTTGCEQPHPELCRATSPLRVLNQGEPWSHDRPLRASVSAMGFGGINAHVVLQGTATDRRMALSPTDVMLLTSAQDAELFLWTTPDIDTLVQELDRLLPRSRQLSWSDLTDVAVHLERRAVGGRVRAAIVASRPAELADRLAKLRSILQDGATRTIDVEAGVFLGEGSRPPRLGFLFPGQGSPASLDGGALRRRFGSAQDLYSVAGIPEHGDARSTEVAQPAIVASSAAALAVLRDCGVEASVAVGHSLGELSALHWAGAVSAVSAIRIATARGLAMARLARSPGAMASLEASGREVESLKNGAAVTIAAFNAPRQTVISGAENAVLAVMSRARERGYSATRLPVSHAFHSSLMEDAEPALAKALSREDFRPIQRAVASTITGKLLSTHDDIFDLLRLQLTAPVQFMEAMLSAGDVDLWIEVGAGRVLSGLARQLTTAPVLPLDAAGHSLRGLLCAFGALFALGSDVKSAGLFAGRFARPFDLDRRPAFFANPCEEAPLPDEVEPFAQESARAYPRNLPLIESEDQSTLTTILDLVRGLVAAMIELPVSAVEPNCRLLNDLHLNSIAVGQLVAEASRHLGLTAPIDPTHYASATVAEIATALDELKRTGTRRSEPSDSRMPAGVDHWVRPFVVALVERSRRPSTGTARTTAGPWRVFAPDEHPLAKVFSRSCKGSEVQLPKPQDVLVCLPVNPSVDDLSLLLDAAKAAVLTGENGRFVLVQQGGGGAAFARSLYLENRGLLTCVVDLPFDHPEAEEWVRAEVESGEGYSESHYDRSGRRRVPTLRLLPTDDRPSSPILGPADLLLVSGGGKGIAAECALALARESGCRLAILGRSRPFEDAELAAQLQRLEQAGLNFRYFVADVTDRDAVRDAVQHVESEWGPVTALVHAAGSNIPQLVSNLDEPALRRTFAPKVQGARNLIAAINPDQLRLFVTFGSIIARTGMRGQADYALANEWLSRLTEEFQAENPSCRCLALEWSVWSGLGMGERLGRIDALVREGIRPIQPEDGISLLSTLISRSQPAVSIVAMGRVAEMLTVTREQGELPFLRFLEKPRVFYPGVELVVDADLSVASDPYLHDHVFQDERIFPAVMGLEAMAQVAQAVLGSNERPVFEDVHFDRPVSVPEVASNTIRLASLVRGPGIVEVVLRCESTAYQVDHFRATCRFGVPTSPLLQSIRHGPDPDAENMRVSIDPERDLYGTILFQSGRFRRLRIYRDLRAKSCSVELRTGGTNSWFGRFLPADLLLSDPGARDASIHAIQACIPHATLLPIGIDRLIFAPESRGNVWIVNATERWQRGATFLYDLAIEDADGLVTERWEGLRLQAIQGTAFQGKWIVPLLGPYFERRILEMIPGASVSVFVTDEPAGDRRTRSDRSLRRALGSDDPILRRPDGRPETNGGRSIAVAHCENLTLAVAGTGPLGCDLEQVTLRPAELWREILGPERTLLAQQIVSETHEEPATAATRVWAIGECLKKAGLAFDTPVNLVSSDADRGVLLAAGSIAFATVLVEVKGFDRPLILAVATGSDHARL